MRFKLNKTVALFIILVNLVMLYYTIRLFISFGDFTKYNRTKPTTSKPTGKPASSNKHISKLVSIVIRDFDLHENDVTLTAQSFINVFPNIQIFILYDELPYPPLELSIGNTTLPNVKLIGLAPSLKRRFEENHPSFHIKTDYVLLVPDSTRILAKQALQLMANELSRKTCDVLVAPVNNYYKELNCLRVNVNVREWTLKYSTITKPNSKCEAISGKHVALLRTELLGKVSAAFLQPFPQAFYLQTALIGKSVRIFKAASFHEGKPVLRSHHAQSQHRQSEFEKLKKLYNLFKIKQVVRESGANEWYGCTRETERCFATVLESMPSYLYEGRWTPPCCLSNLRKTAKHVFNHFEESGIRFWLEAGSLLGAMRSGDILPWDHDVDVGFNSDDLHRSVWLNKAKSRPILDKKGFLWEKATEGNFYRVYYSKVNRIFVNLFPFYAKNGTMSKDSWFTSHRNMEFPDNFLHPMSSIEFIGRSVPSPNNIRDFLEYKFGKGAIENPQYSDPNKLKFPQ